MLTQDNFVLTPEELQQLVGFFKKNYGKPCYTLVADVKQNITPLTSRIGGLPYWDFAKAYPTDEQGEVLRFLCQINLEQLPDNSEGLKLLPRKGLLQFFTGRDDVYGCTYEPDNSGCKVVYFPEIAPADAKLTMDGLRLRLAENGLNEDEVSNLFLGDDDYWALEGECAIKLVPGTDFPHIGDDEFFLKAVSDGLKEVFNFTFNDKYKAFDIIYEKLEDEYEFSKLLKANLQLSEDDEELDFGSLLGYPDFTQCNPLEDGSYGERFDTLLLRLDDVEAEPNFHMMWGDCGIANFFMGSKALAKRDFSDIFYTWDCC